MNEIEDNRPAEVGMKNLLREGLVLDGAMGTELIAKGLRNGEASIAWNLSRPDDVWAVHHAYMLAGARALTTNSFGGNLLMLRRYGMEDQMTDLNREAVQLARSASMGRARVLADIGPCGDFLDPMGDLEPEELACAIREQASALATVGVDGFIVETMSDPNEVSIVVATLKAYFGLPVIATYAFEKGAKGFQTMMGSSPARAVKIAIDAGADAVGANCGTSLSLADYLTLGRQIAQAAGPVPVVLQPNAGTPDATVDGYRYEVTPQEFGAWGASARGMKVQVLGGCCGTTPSHIEALDSALALA